MHEIRSYRYANGLARQRVGALTLVVRPTLLDAFRDQFAGVDVCAYEEVGTFDCWASIMSLVHIFRTQAPSDLPSAPYLRATSHFRPLAGDFKVGFAWATKDPTRATQLADWAPILGVAGVRFYSFQTFELCGDPTELHRAGVPIEDLSPEPATGRTPLRHSRRWIL